MDVMRFPRARRLGLAGACAICLLAAAWSAPLLEDVPIVWHEEDRRDIPMPTPRDPNVIASALDASLFRPLGRLLNPARLVRGFGTVFGGQPAHPAANPNALDEVPSSTWFTNRLGLFPLSPSAVARGPHPGGGPDASGPLVVFSAKTEGVTPGFFVRDIHGNRYVVKFDPPGYPGLTTAADIITGRILHAAGYNVPHDVIVPLRREQLIVGEGVRFTPEDGEEREMTESDLDAILGRVQRSPDGRWRALASRFLAGADLGPFDWRGRRKDDPNDRVNHEDRRELRGFRMFAAWLCHYDTKQGNTLDMFVEEDGRHFVRHHFIDFASTLGGGARGPVPTACHEFTADMGLTLGRTLALGLWEDPWRRTSRPEDLDEIGRYRAEGFHPIAFKPLEPNAAFANFTTRDGYWAAKIISAFTDAHLAALVAEAQYEDPAAADWMVRVLGERRDIIARYFFDRIPPLDFFQMADSGLRFHDLGTERGLYPDRATSYRYRIGDATPDGRVAERGPWVEGAETVLEIDRRTDSPAAREMRPFLAVDIQVDRGMGWSGTVRVFIARQSERVVRVER
jgi:hypothetical protein